MSTNGTFCAFVGTRRVSSGSIETVLRAAHAEMERSPDVSILYFDEDSGRQIDFDMRGSVGDILGRLSAHPHFVGRENPVAEPPRSGPGRPKLGVVCREVSLLPRHWEWLETQSAGASGTLRRLVDEARQRARPDAGMAARRDATSRFLWAVAGDLQGFEEASRALFAGDEARFGAIVATWPRDVVEQARRMLGG